MSETDAEVSMIVENVIRGCILEIERQQMSKEDAVILSVITNNSPEDGSYLLSPSHSHVTNPDVTMEAIERPAKKQPKQQQPRRQRKLANHENKIYNEWMDEYLERTGRNLYPTKPEKIQIAAETHIPYEDVGRLINNRRRIKRQKARSGRVEAAPSPVMAEFMAESGGLQPIVNEPSALSPQIVDFMQAAPAAQIIGGEGEDLYSPDQNLLENMVALHNIQQQYEIPPMAQLLHLALQQQQQQDGTLSVEPNQAEQAAKLVAFQQPNVQLLMLILQQQMQSGQSLNLNAAVQQVQAHIFQQQVSQLHAQIQSMQMQQHEQQQLAKEIAQQQQHQQQQQWGGSSISASPMVNSDSEISEQSELSPRVYMQMLEQQQQQQHQQQLNEEMMANEFERMRSPPFKDPHQIADPEMTMLLDTSSSTDIQFDHSSSSLAYSRLSEREKLAVAALTDLGTKTYFR